MSGGTASAVEPFPETAFLFKRGSLGFELAGEQVATNVEQGQRRVGLELG